MLIEIILQAYEFKYELTISDEEYLGIKATRDLYIEEVNECYNDECEDYLYEDDINDISL